MKLGFKTVTVVVLSLSLINCKKMEEKDIHSGDISNIFEYKPDAPLCNTIDPENISTEVSCNCTIDDYKSALSENVVGTSVYHASSDICSAAKHSSILNQSKPSTVIILPGQQCSNFFGSKMNGLSSLSRFLSGNEPTFYFKGFSDGACAAVPNKSICAATTLTWSITGETCTGTIAEYNGPEGGTKVATDSKGEENSPTGTANFICSGNAWISIPQEGAVCSSLDFNPDVFSFTTRENAALNTNISSGSVSVVGFSAPSKVNVSGGSYRIYDGTAWSSWVVSTGTINYGNKIQLGHKSSNLNATLVTTTVTIGTVTATFSSRTFALDSNPTPFTFSDRANVELNSIVTSASINISGINTIAPVNISGGSFRIFNGTIWSNWLVSTGSISDGNKIQVSHRASSVFSTPVNTVLTIGTVTDTFTSTTVAIDTTPEPFHFVDQEGVSRNANIQSNELTINTINSSTAVTVTNGSYRIYNGTNWSSCTTSAGQINKGFKIKACHKSAANFATAISTTITIGGVSDIFTSTTLAEDTQPNAFTLDDKNNVYRNTEYESNWPTINGINSDTVITVTGGSYAIYDGHNWSAWTSASGTIKNGYLVKVKHKSASNFKTTTTTRLTVGGISEDFKTTTVNGVDLSAVSSFSFTEQSNVNTATSIISEPFELSGLTAAGASLSITVTHGDEFRYYNGRSWSSWRTTALTVYNGYRIQVGHTSASAYNTSITTEIKIGTKTGRFKSTTKAAP
jgi:hypothetical protein